MGSEQAQQRGPKRHLPVFQALLVTLGMVITTDILKTAPTVALNVGPEYFYWVWVLGGVCSMVGALCFAEMATAFPHPGGDYHFLRTAYGERLGFVFAWSRFSVMHTGWIALSAFMFADYFNAIVPLGTYGSGLFAGGVIASLVLLNLTGKHIGFITQTVLVALLTVGFLSIAGAGVWLTWRGVEVPVPAVSVAPEQTGMAGFSSAMIFVFLAFGGWSDAATLSAEVRDGRRGMLIAMLGALTVLMSIYLALNWAFVQGLGFAGLAASNAPAVELLNRAFGAPGGVLIVLMVGIAAVASINSTLLVGARTTYAAAQDVPQLQGLGDWDERHGVPRKALLAEGAVALLLVLLGSFTQSGFNTMVEYLTPVYWLFLSLSSVALLILRRRFPDTPRPIKVPLYPLLPLLFFALCLYMLYSSVTAVGYGALLGIGVLLFGVVLLGGLSRWASPSQRAPAA
ncbi:APC family permease [Pseudomonas nunensis]|uniref:APC family permease n=1 Tax=Pseudomonas nunensis TaxID=2961896 RepID=A0ABY5EPB2_9PSED|nr:APC family permease [Pseudomonas nunensis]KPN90280.1 amino acid permease [Pseudomonas nunensis]MCL5227870.1 APC family permease [Pseudomonas nunensis]UTO16520.1 APC family permease [Pseudomonas nunensis]